MAEDAGQDHNNCDRDQDPIAIQQCALVNGVRDRRSLGLQAHKSAGSL